MNHHTAAQAIAFSLVHNVVIASLISLLSEAERPTLAARLEEALGDVGTIDEYEPECSQLQKQQLLQWIDALRS